jgi:hypothetical protein
MFEREVKQHSLLMLKAPLFAEIVFIESSKAR